MAGTRHPILRSALAGGLLAGLADILYACGFNWLRSGVTPDRIFRFIASGLIGSAAFESGAWVVALGFALHFAISVMAALVYVLACTRAGVLARRPFVSGALFGVLVFLAMNYVVLPLSQAPASLPKGDLGTWTDLLSHMVFGVIIALFARRARQT